ncbi:cytochrome P460 family protein [Coralliovum pocilloporae]|uniref:cytochrome P460 family protein n=1 Tax=Coralliovum pocilloporae TaxID=3066369 RepID=UPI00330741A0
MTKKLAAIAVFGATLGVAGLTGIETGSYAPSLTSPAHAAACETKKAKDDLTDADATALYDCIKDKLAEGYKGSGLEEATAFRSWFVPNTNTFVSPTHGKRFVQHYINDIGKEAYLKYDDVDKNVMPVGTIAAKESFAVSKKDGKVRPGPLFLMEKVAAGTLPDTGDWKYTLISPKGKIIGQTGTESEKKIKFCHGCHQNALEDYDAMFFPDVDYRVEG